MPHDTSALQSLIADSVQKSVHVKNQLVQLYPKIAAAAELLVDVYERSGQIIFIGNGGSAADAQHFAAELVGRFRFDRPPLGALALSTNSSAVTAIGNDMGYTDVFARQLRAHARPGDGVVLISTSGISANVVAAAKLKEELQLRVVSLTGENGAALEPFSNIVLAVPSRSTPRIQEAHQLIGHILCDWIERSLFEAG